MIDGQLCPSQEPCAHTQAAPQRHSPGQTSRAVCPCKTWCAFAKPGPRYGHPCATDAAIVEACHVTHAAGEMVRWQELAHTRRAAVRDTLAHRPASSLLGHWRQACTTTCPACSYIVSISERACTHTRGAAPPSHCLRSNPTEVWPVATQGHAWRSASWNVKGHDSVVGGSGLPPELWASRPAPMHMPVCPPAPAQVWRSCDRPVMMSTRLCGMAGSAPLHSVIPGSFET